MSSSSYFFWLLKYKLISFRISTEVLNNLTNQKDDDSISYGIDHLEYNIGSKVLRDVKIYSSERPDSVGNGCAINNGGCKELCAFDGEKPVCLCSHGKLGEDNLSCQPFDAFLIYSRVSRDQCYKTFLIKLMLT